MCQLISLLKLDFQVFGSNDESCSLWYYLIFMNRFLGQLPRVFSHYHWCEFRRVGNALRCTLTQHGQHDSLLCQTKIHANALTVYHDTQHERLIYNNLYQMMRITYRAPLPNGIQPVMSSCSSSASLCSPLLAKRSGSNDVAFLKTFSLCRILNMSTVMVEPFGINVPERTVSWVTTRGTIPITGPFMRSVFVSRVSIHHQNPL